VDGVGQNGDAVGVDAAGDLQQGEAEVEKERDAQAADGVVMIRVTASVVVVRVA